MNHFLFWFTTYIFFCNFSVYVVGSSGETCHWCCNKQWVISEFLHFLCIYWQHTVCLFISFCFFVCSCSHHCITVNYTQRNIWSTTTQSKEVFMFLRCDFCVDFRFYHSVTFPFIQWSQTPKQNKSFHILKLYYLEQSVIIK